MRNEFLKRTLSMLCGSTLGMVIFHDKFKNLNTKTYISYFKLTIGAALVYNIRRACAIEEICLFYTSSII